MNTYVDENGNVKTKMNTYAEIHRLRNALQKIANLDPDEDGDEWYKEYVNQAQKIADEALNENNNTNNNTAT